MPSACAIIASSTLSVSHTPNHLSEHRGAAVEFGFISDETDTERVEEAMMAHALGTVAKDCEAELELLGAHVEKPSLPFPEVRFPISMTYSGNMG